MQIGRVAKILILVLASLFVTSQATAIQHDVDHVWHEQTELCDVFAFAEKSANDQLSSPRLVEESYDSNYGLILTSLLVGLSQYQRPARAPPYS